MRQKPYQAIEVFGSKAARTNYGLKKTASTDASGPFPAYAQDAEPV
jgi:hypothetical protein